MTSRFCVVRRDLAHVAGHLHAAHDRAGEQTLTDGAGAAMPALGAVRGIDRRAKPWRFTTPSKPRPLVDADGVNEIAGRKQRRADDVAGLHFLGEIRGIP